MDKISSEKAVIAKMIGIYCSRLHNVDKDCLCDECSQLLDYALKRLDNCPKGNRKRSCRKCDIHCYSPSRRSQIREVMRYVGPKMLFIHPVDAIRHLISEMR